MKTCFRCKRKLELKEFHKNLSRGDGVDSYCLRCSPIYRREHYLLYKKKILEKNKEYRTKNREKVLLMRKLYYKRHRQEQLFKKHINHIELKNRVLKILGNKCVSCQETNPILLCIDHIRGGGRQDRMTLTTEGLRRKISNGYMDGYQLLCYNCNWIKRWDNYERYNPTSNNYSTLQNRKLRLAVISKFGNQCSVDGCLIKNPRMLHIDHVGGGGNQDRKQRGVAAIYRSLLKSSDNLYLSKFQLLCANHHALKTYENKSTRRKY